MRGTASEKPLRGVDRRTRNRIRRAVRFGQTLPSVEEARLALDLIGRERRNVRRSRAVLLVLSVCVGTLTALAIAAVGWACATPFIFWLLLVLPTFRVYPMLERNLALAERVNRAVADA